MDAPTGNGIPLCKHECKELYLYDTDVNPGADSTHVTFHFRCARCGAAHLGQLDEHYIARVLKKTQRMANNENPPSCPL